MSKGRNGLAPSVDTVHTEEANKMPPSIEHVEEFAATLESNHQLRIAYSQNGRLVSDEFFRAVPFCYWKDACVDDARARAREIAADYGCGFVDVYLLSPEGNRTGIYSAYGMDFQTTLRAAVFYGAVILLCLALVVSASYRQRDAFFRPCPHYRGKTIQKPRPMAVAIGLFQCTI